MPWIKEEKLYPIIALLLVLIMAARTPLDTDMWWHLRAGEETWVNHDVYDVDTFSFTRSGEDWINHSWLSQVLMYLVYRLGSYSGLTIWVGLSAVLSMFFIYLQLKGHPLLRSAVLILAAVVSSVVWSPRPQIHTLVLFALLSYLLYRYRSTRRYGYLMGSIPIFLLWGNLHGGYVLGIILIVSYIAGEIVDKLLLHHEYDDLSWKQIGFHVMLLGCCLVVVLINPFGLDMWRIPFNTVGVETLQNVINEWASPDFHQFFQQPMLWMLLGLFSLLALSKKGISGTDLIPLMVFTWAALTARRNFGPFAIVAAPVFADRLNDQLLLWLEAAKNDFRWVHDFVENAKQSNTELRPGVKNVINLGLILALSAAGIWKIVDVSNKDFVQQAEARIFPVNAVEVLKAEELEGNLLNDYNWGGYLIWNLRQKPVFVDGRTDLFGDEILRDYLSVLSLQPGWDDVLEDYRISNVLIQSGSELDQALRLSGWEVFYQDEDAVIFHR